MNNRSIDECIRGVYLLSEIEDEIKRLIDKYLYIYNLDKSPINEYAQNLWIESFISWSGEYGFKCPLYHVYKKIGARCLKFRSNNKNYKHPSCMDCINSREINYNFNCRYIKMNYIKKLFDIYNCFFNYYFIIY